MAKKLNSSQEEIKERILQKLSNNYGQTIEEANKEQIYNSAALVLRDSIMEKWIKYRKERKKEKNKELFYLSFEFLMGRSLGNNLLNAGLSEDFSRALEALGCSLDESISVEKDAGLGNGGLGRLAACFMDSLATLNLPAYGCSIRYEYGLFKQKIVDGAQIEMPDNWLDGGSVWEVEHPEESVKVRFGGNVYTKDTPDGMEVYYDGTTNVIGVPYDVPVIGYNSEIVNTLRLWSARAEKDIDLTKFSGGDYLRAVEEKALSEVLSKVLYPEDNHQEGKALRLKQQYFFVSCTVQWIISRFKRKYGAAELKNLADYTVIHINDTHPAIAIAELMRVLMDEERMSWDDAWEVTKNVFAYTNHTIMAEALEKWSVDMLKLLLPRIFMIIEEMNRRLVNDLHARYGDDWGKINYMSIIANNYVNMANMCLATCYKVNGVSRLHTEILKNDVFRDYNSLSPDKFVPITNGITFRRWLKLSNPELSELITSKIGDGWIKDASELEKLIPYSEDVQFQKAFKEVKQKKKIELAKYIKEHNGIEINPDSIFDVQVKRLHEYKRQLLNVLHILYLYDKIKNNPSYEIYPHTFIFGAKASPGYTRAKLIIKLINDVAELVNNDKDVNNKIKVVFLENYGVSLAQMIIPASDISEQISTAGKEASGTGNMKFMANGALTLGTLDGANVEMRELVGDENIFIFGLTAQEVSHKIQSGENSSQSIYATNKDVKRVIDMLIDSTINPANPRLYYDLYQALIFGDYGGADKYMVVRDFESYCHIHREAARQYQDDALWCKKAIINISKSGYFSSDRTIEEYNDKIWKLKNYNK